MNMKRALLILGATLIASAPVQAALTIQTYTNKAQWDAAVSGKVVENFDFEALGSFTNRNFPGFTAINEDPQTMTTAILDGAAASNINGTRFMDFYADCDFTPTDGLVLDLDKPTQAVSFDWHNTDPSGDKAAMEIIVDGQTFVFGAPGAGFFGIVVTSGGGFSAIRLRDTTGDGCALTSLGIDNFAFVEANVALFKVTKTFVPASSASVTVKLECDGGLPLEQTDVVKGGDAEGTTFVLTNTQSAPDCVITETTPSGYSGSPANCTFNNVNNVVYTCAFTNTAQPVKFGFTKIWEVSGTGGDLLDKSSKLTIECTQPIVSASPTPSQSGTYYRTWKSTSGAASAAYYVTVNASGATPACWVEEEVKDSAVEVTKAGACGTKQSPVSISIGGSTTSCTITNTVFYEGIPTLSQYGMAIMALLMLGVGFVGFRRFV